MGDDASIAGRVLAEKYLLIERLGEGGFGSIWRAEHQVLKSPIAVKLIDLEVARREGAVERFLREAQATAALRSPHVVQVLDYGLDKRVENGVECEQPFIVMELLEGENVADRLAHVGPLPPLEVVRVVTHVARAMSRAHELGIVHRDLKPENIFLVNNGDAEVAKVLDFGVAKIASPMDLNPNTYTQTGSMVGTPYYMSPEQAQGNKAVDYRSDLWALGVITFEMLTGQRPFDSDALGDLVLSICMRDLPIPSQFGPVPAGFDAWFAHAVARDPEQRFQSARELALALLELVESADSGVRYTQFDELTSLKPGSPKPGELGYAAEIPSRPVHSAFAATVRDETLAQSILESTPRVPVVPTDVTESPGDAEERLAPWALAGMAVLALAAGAAAVYGLFHLLRDPNNNDASFASPSASYEGSAANRPALRSKRKGDVVTTNRPNPNQTTAKTQSIIEKTSTISEHEVGPTKSPETSEPTVAPLASASVQPQSVSSVSPLEGGKTGDDAAPTFRQDATPTASASPSPVEPLITKTTELTSNKLPALSDPPQPATLPIDALPMVTD